MMARVVCNSREEIAVSPIGSAAAVQRTGPRVVSRERERVKSCLLLLEGAPTARGYGG